MAYSFDGSTDRIDWANVWDPVGNAISVSMWLYPTSSTAYALNIGDSSDDVGVVLRTYTDEKYIWLRSGSTSKYRGTATSTVSLNTWQNIVATDPMNDFGDYTEMKIYKDGSEVTYSDSNSQNGVTEKAAFSGDYSLGGKKIDDTRNYAGYIAELGVWDRVITSNEINLLSKGYSPLFVPNGLRFYVPIVRHLMDMTSGNYGTLDGTTVVEHPDVICPTAPIY